MATNVAFEILYKEYYFRVFGLCRRLLNSADMAEDAAQEVFMRAYQNFDRYDNSKPFWRWIASIASNYCIDLLRNKTRLQQFFAEEDSALEHIESADKQQISALIHVEDVNALNGAIAKLDPKYRVPLVLAYYNESSYEQIASKLSISRSHVGVLLLRAKQQISKHLTTQNAGDGEV